MKSPYYVQPARGGHFLVLHKPCGNRIAPKECGLMPSRAHAQALIRQLERAESAVDDLFLEATDDGIEALEAILAACVQDVLAKPAEELERMARPAGSRPKRGGPPRRGGKGGGSGKGKGGAGGGARKRR
ncbi:MAG TPA: hypothetical protein VGD77_10320 [Gemmatimonadaceae bacterium]